MLDVIETVYAQFANSPRLLTFIESANQSIDPSALIETFYSQVFNPVTATGWGLDVWGRIVGVSRTIQVASGRWLGFDEATDATNTLSPFNDAPFYSGMTRDGLTSNYTMSDDAFRKLIFAKAASNISDGSITSINAILMSLFGSDTELLWIEEDMATRTITVAYNFDLSLVDATVLEASGILPRPSGVSIKYRRVNDAKQ